MEHVGGMQTQAKGGQKLRKTRGAGNSPSRWRRVGRGRLVRRGQARGTRRLGSRELDTVPVGGAVSSQERGQGGPQGLHGPTPLAPHCRGEQRVLRVTGPLQGASASPVLTRTKHSTAWGVEASPVGAGAVPGGHAHVVLESKTLHCLLVSSVVCPCSPKAELSTHLAGAHPQMSRTLLPNTHFFPISSIGGTHTIGCKGHGEGVWTLDFWGKRPDGHSPRGTCWSWGWQSRTMCPKFSAPSSTLQALLVSRPTLLALRPGRGPSPAGASQKGSSSQGGRAGQPLSGHQALHRMQAPGHSPATACPGDTRQALALRDTG